MEMICYQPMWVSSPDLLATLIKSSNSCIVSRDTRPSGQILAYATLTSLLEQGVQVFYLDIAPTPITFREARKHKGGIIITASHNPLNWNGLKFILNGRGISEQDLEGILAYKEHRPSNTRISISDYFLICG